MATAHIRKRVSKDNIVSYQVIAEGDCDPTTGRRDRHYRTARTRKEAEALKRSMIAELESGGIQAPPKPIKLESWMKRWLDEFLPDIAATTRAGYEEKINGYIIPRLGHFQLNALNAEIIQKWANDLKREGLSPKTIRNAYNNLNAALKKAVTLRMIPYNPCEGVALPKLVKYEGKIYSAKDIQKVLEIAKGTDEYLLILLAVTVGLRRGELAALKWDHVDLTGKVLHIQENMVRAKGECITKSPKSKAGIRTISVGDEVVTALSKAKMDYFNDKAELGRGFHDDGYVIRQKNGLPYHPDSITQKWERFLAKYDLSRIRLHGLRHSNATALIEAGVSPKVVQQRLGHADIGMTLGTYTHVSTVMDQQAADTIDSLMFAKAGNL